MFCKDLVVEVPVRDEVGLIAAQGEFKNVLDWRGFGEKGFDVRG